jgi:hypothetical protein
MKLEGGHGIIYNALYDYKVYNGILCLNIIAKGMKYIIIYTL